MTKIDKVKKIYST